METATEKVKVTFKYTEEKEVEFSIPCFRRQRQYAYKVIDQNTCLQINHRANSAEIVMSHPKMAWLFDDAQDCTEGEFQALFNETMQRLIDLSVK